MIELFFGAIIALLANSQYSFDDCKSTKFEGKQCKLQKAMHDLGQKSKR